MTRSWGDGDLLHDGAAFDDLWVPKLVETVLVEAVRLTMRIAGRVGPSGIKNNMPAHLYDWADQLAQVETEELGKGGNRVRLGATSEQITRMEAAIRWPIVYLATEDDLRAALQLYLKCKALRLRFGQACKERGWPRATAYRQRDRALVEIAIGLNRDAVPVDLRGIEIERPRTGRVLYEDE